MLASAEILKWVAAFIIGAVASTTVTSSFQTSAQTDYYVADSYAVLNDELVKVEQVNSSVLVEQLSADISFYEAEASAYSTQYASELSALNEYKAAAEEISGKYPNAADELDRAYDDRLVEADTIRGLAVQYEELASEKQAELDALNEAMLAQAPKG